MRARDIVAVASNAAGTVFVASTSGTVGRLDGDRLAPLPLPYPDARITALASTDDDRILAADAYSNRVLSVDGDGVWAAIGGIDQKPSLQARASRSDGPAASARFKSLRALAWTDGRVYAFEAADAKSCRVVEAGVVSTVDLPSSLMGEVTAAVATSDGALVLCDAVSGLPCLFRWRPGSVLVRLAGDDSEAGDADGVGSTARFARIAALAATRTGTLVADGARVRHVGTDGRVTTIAGGAPGFVDGDGSSARFGSIRALGVVAGSEIVVADPDNAALRWIDAEGRVRTCFIDDTRSVDDAEMQRLARAFGSAIVDNDVDSAWEIASRLLVEHGRSGARRPERAGHPISVASARVGREVAIDWCLSADPNRARLGGYCLWLIRSEERLAAPIADAFQLVDVASSALATSDLTRARLAVDVVNIAFGMLARRRDRLAVAAAYRGTDAARRAADALASGDRSALELAIDVVRQSRDVRFTAVLAAMALEDGHVAARALAALKDVWDTPAFSPEQAADLRASLRFGRAAMDRLLADRGDTALGTLGAARYRRLLGRARAR